MNEPDVDALLAGASLPKPAAPNSDPADHPIDDPVDSPIDDGRLLAYVQDRLSDEERVELEAHLAHSDADRALLIEMMEPVPAELAAWAEQHMGEAPAEHRRSKSRRWAVGSAVALVASVAAVVALFPLRSPDRGGAGFARVGYQVEGPFGGVRSQRGASSATVADASAPTIATYHPGMRITAILRPEDDLPAEAHPQFAAYIEAPVPVEQGRLTRVDPRFIETTEAGGCVLQAPVEAVFGPLDGRYVVHFVARSPRDASWPSTLDAPGALDGLDGVQLRAPFEVRYQRDQGDEHDP